VAVRAAGWGTAARDRVRHEGAGDWRGELRSQLVRAKPFAEKVGSDDDGSDDDGSDAEAKPRWAQRLKQASSVRDGMARLFEEASDVYFSQGSRIQGMLAQAIGTPNEKLFSLADFNRPALDLSLPVVLSGKRRTSARANTPRRTLSGRRWCARATTSSVPPSSQTASSSTTSTSASGRPRS